MSIEDEIRRNNVLIEQMVSQFRTFGEGQQMLNEKVDRLEKKMQAGFMEVHTWISSLEKSNQEEHAEIIQKLERLDKEVQVELKRIK